MLDAVRQVRLYRRKSGFFASHESRVTRWRTTWAFLRREAFVTWPLYGIVLPALKEDRLQIGKQTSFLAGCWLSVPGKGRLVIGHHSYINLGVTIHAYGLIEIGDFTGIGNGTFITDATHRVDDPVRPFIEQGMEPSKPVRIGNNVWIGVNSTIMPGVTIGDRAIVGSGSVVTRDVEPYTVVAGAPARFLRKIEYADPPAELG